LPPAAECRTRDADAKRRTGLRHERRLARRIEAPVAEEVADVTVRPEQAHSYERDEDGDRAAGPGAHASQALRAHERKLLWPS
jgi:hypothetical protein